MIKNIILKSYEYIKNNKLKSIFILLLILILPIIIIDVAYKIGSLLNDRAMKTFFQASDILNYVGVIIGTVLGGFVTFYALYITIKSEKDERKEDRRLQIYPYVKYEVKNNFFDSKGSCMEISSHTYMSILKNKYHIFRNEDGGVSFLLTIENIGVKALINFSILEIKALGETAIPQILGHIKVDETENHDIHIKMTSKDKLDRRSELTKDGMLVTVAYCDMMENYYEQDINIGFKENQSHPSDPNPSEEITYRACLKQDNVTKPRFYENKDIFEEIEKRK